MSSNSARSKSVLITGASSGIGYHLSLEFAKRGYTVFAGARRTEPMKPLEEKGIHTLQLDVTSTESIAAAKKVIVQQTGGTLDILYNNAGVNQKGAVLDLDIEEMKRTFGTNVFGPVELIKVFQRPLLLAKGTVVFTDSAIINAPFPFAFTYQASKTAFAQISKALYLETEKFGLKVINVVTGAVESPMGDYTRSFKTPKDSIYYLEDDDVVKPFKTKVTPTAEYATEVIDKVERAIKSNTPYSRIYAGAQAGTSWYVNAFLSLQAYKKVLFGLFLDAEKPLSRVAANLEKSLADKQD